MRLFCLFALVLVMAPSSGAHAGPKETVARAEYEKGTIAYNLGRFDEAAEHYETAYRAVPDPNFLFNIAQSHRMAGKLEQALPVFRAFLRESSAGAPNRGLAERLVDELKRKIENKTNDQPTPPISTKPAVEAAPPPPDQASSTSPAAASAQSPGPAPSVAPTPAAPISLAPAMAPTPAAASAITMVPAPVAEPSAPVASALVGRPALVPSAVVEQPATPAPAPASTGKGLRIAGITCGAVGLASIGTGIYYYIFCQRRAVRPVERDLCPNRPDECGARGAHGDGVGKRKGPRGRRLRQFQLLGQRGVVWRRIAILG